MPSQSRKITACACLAAVGIILGYIESFIVIPVQIPGIRIGLANTVTIIAMYTLGSVYAGAVLLIRIIMSAMLFGSPASFLYSICGGAAAFTGMMLFKKAGFHIFSVSVCGAVLHNMGQICIAAVLIGNSHVLYYLPVLTLSGSVFGLLTGILAKLCLGRLGAFFRSNESEGIK